MFNPIDSSLWHFNAATGVLIAAYSACLLSFNWGMYRFFTEPGGSNSGIDIVKLLGTAMGLASLIGIPLFGVHSALTGLAGLLLCGLSLSLFWWAIRTNSRRPLSFAFSDDLPEHLVCDGPYRYIRHPFYTSYLIAWLAAAVATWNVFMLMPMAVMGALYLSAASIEERKFEASRLSAAYQRYRKQTGMFFPMAFRTTNPDV